MNKKEIGTKFILLSIIFYFFSFSIFAIDFADLEDKNYKIEIPKKKLIKTSIGVSIIVSSSFLLDDIIREKVQNNQSEMMTNYFNKVDDFGSKDLPLMLLGGTYSIGLMSKNEKLKKTTLISLKSILTSFLTTGLIKGSVGRERPYVSGKSNKYKPFSFFDYDYRSFPSGHTTIAWSYITPFAENYSRIFYVIPISVVGSRIYKDKHWFSDTLMGTVIGFGFGYFFSKEIENIDFQGNNIIIKF